jgi:hypothetical protein
MDPWTTPWGMPWGMPIVWALVGIAVFAILATGALFTFMFWYARNNLGVDVRLTRSEPERLKLRA